MPETSPRRVLFHPDPERLEEELAARIQSVKSEAGPWARVLVTVPTQRQVRRLRVRLAERDRAVLGVEIFKYIRGGDRVFRVTPANRMVVGEIMG